MVAGILTYWGWKNYLPFGMEVLLVHNDALSPPVHGLDGGMMTSGCWREGNMTLVHCIEEEGHHFLAYHYLKNT